MVDTWLTLPGGRRPRFRQRNIPTQELARELLRRVSAEAFGGKAPEGRRERVTVAMLWEAYKAVGPRKRSWDSDLGRAKHLLAEFGDVAASALTLIDVERYRARRSEQRTVRGCAPSPGTLDREVALLKRLINYGVECGVVESNPLARVALLREPNTRDVVLDDEMFELLLDGAEPALRPILVGAYETGMRKREVLNLKWSQVDLRAGLIRLGERDTKSRQGRLVPLRARACDVLRGLPAPGAAGRLGAERRGAPSQREAEAVQPRQLRSEYVFANPATGQPYVNVRKMFARAKKAAGLPDIWFHDLRRSFITNARRHGVAELVVMRMSGHRTRSVFERYNIVSAEDLLEAARSLDSARQGTDRLGQSLDKVESEGVRNEKGSRPAS